MISWTDRTVERVKDMLKAIAEIREGIKGKTVESFVSSRSNNAEAVLGLIILGEAANGIEREVQEKYSKIPWRDIIGLRNILVHAYGQVDYEEVWSIATKDLNQLEENLNEMLASYPWPA